MAGTEIQFQLTLPENASSEDVAWDIPRDCANLVVRAVERTRELLNLPFGGKIRLEKRIPAAAGLAGGSSDAAAAIVASMAGWGVWDRVVAEKVASELGSDIQFFLGDEVHGVGLARATGRGETLAMLGQRPEMQFAVTHPAEGCSTARVYSLVNLPSDPKSIGEMLAACVRGDVGRIGEELYNALAQPAARLTAWIAKQLELFHHVGAHHASMTGSGSACFAMASSFSAAQEIAAKMSQLGLPRAYASKTWYAQSIESQLRSILGSV